MSSPDGDWAYDVELRAATKRFGWLTAVDSVSLKVRKGEFLSLLWPSGCGRTTSLRLIAGFEQPDEDRANGWPVPRPPSSGATVSSRPPT